MKNLFITILCLLFSFGSFAEDHSSKFEAQLKQVILKSFKESGVKQLLIQGEQLTEVEYLDTINNISELLLKIDEKNDLWKAIQVTGQIFEKFNEEDRDRIIEALNEEFYLNDKNYIKSLDASLEKTGYKNTLFFGEMGWSVDEYNDWLSDVDEQAKFLIKWHSLENMHKTFIEFIAAAPYPETVKAEDLKRLVKAFSHNFNELRN